MTGTSTTAAPSSRSRADNAGAWVRARVTTTVLPNSGRRTNQSSSCAATSPTTITDGAASSWSSSVASVARTVRWTGRVPHWTAAAGVDASSPARIRRLLIAGQRATAIRITRVPPTRATASQSTVVVESGSSWPVTTVNDVDE